MPIAIESLPNEQMRKHSVAVMLGKRYQILFATRDAHPELKNQKQKNQESLHVNGLAVWATPPLNLDNITSNPATLPAIGANDGSVTYDHPSDRISSHCTKMAKNTGKPFEAFVKSVYDALTEDDRFTSVELNVELPGPDGPRQIDVLLRSRVAHFEVLTVIECRDYSSRLDITHIDGFHSKLRDVGANKGIMVSRIGFSKSAFEKAKRVGITLCVASTADDLLPKLGIQIPLEVFDVTLASLRGSSSFEVHTPTKVTMKELLTINGSYVPELLRSELINGTIDIPTNSTTIRWSPASLNAPYSFADLSGIKYQVDRIEFDVELVVRKFFGYVHQIPSILIHQEFESDVFTMIMRSEEMPGLVDHLVECGNETEKHIRPILTLFLISLPNSFDDVPITVRLRRLSDLGTHQ